VREAPFTHRSYYTTESIDTTIHIYYPSQGMGHDGGEGPGGRRRRRREEGKRS